MCRPFRRALALLAVVSLFPALAFAAPAAQPAAEGQKAKKKIVFLAGGRSHGFGAHDHLSGCHLLATKLKEAMPGYETVVSQGWPKDAKIFEGADAVVMYSDGGDRHFAIPHIKELDALHEKGVGIGAIHYAVEVPKGEAGDHWLKWMGGYFETHWSVNPHWVGKFTEFPKHPVASGLQRFQTNDEWYYNMRFRPNMEGVTPVLSAVPPDETRTRKPGPHSGNDEVRKGVGKEQREHVLWVSENKNGSRGFGTTGGHVHWNWAQDDWRTAVLNAIVWVAKGEVPEGGVKTATPTMDELLANHDEPVPNNFDREKKAKEIEELNRKQTAGR